jgi:hypothetical protein
MNFSFKIGSFGSFLEHFCAPDFQWKIGPNPLIRKEDSGSLRVLRGMSRVSPHIARNFLQQAGYALS